MKKTKNTLLTVMVYTKCFSNKTLYIFSECFVCVCVCVYSHSIFKQTNIHIYIYIYFFFFFYCIKIIYCIKENIFLFLIKKMFNEKYGNVERIV